jgi:hypothetical protein
LAVDGEFVGAFDRAAERVVARMPVRRAAAPGRAIEQRDAHLAARQSRPFGRLIADARPKLVKAVVAVEPAGPPLQNTVFGTEKARAWGGPTSRSHMIRR